MNILEKHIQKDTCPDNDEMQKRFIRMHKEELGINKCKKIVSEVEKNMDEFEEKVDGEIIDKLSSIYSLPKFNKEKNSFDLLKINVKNGLKKRNIYNKKYIKRAIEELKVIKSNSFEDYFLIVQDYVMWGKK